MFRWIFIVGFTVGWAAPGGDMPLHMQTEAPYVPFYDRNYAWVDSLMEQMTVEEKIGQLFMAAAYSNKDAAHEQAISKLIREQKIGGLIFMQGGPVRQARLTNNYQSIASVPLLIAMDAEWGPAMRLDSVISFQRQLTWGAVQNDSLIYQTGKAIAEQLRRLGVQVNFAPVVDINNNPKNPVIGDRSFGEDKYNVTLKGLAYMNGLQENGIIACAKHFPGHGDTDADSHKTLPVIAHNRNRLDTLELFPFSVMMQQGLGSVMLAHLFIPSLDNTPGQASSMSPAVGRTMLRDSLGFRGLVFSDALNMKGVADHYASGELEVQAFLAGNDVLLFSENIPKSIAAMRQAYADGRITEQRLDESVVRILKAKAYTGLQNAPKVKVQNIQFDLNKTEYKQLKRRITEQSITLVQATDSMIPMATVGNKKIATLAISDGSSMPFQSAVNNYTEAASFRMNRNADAATVNKTVAQLQEYDLVIVGLEGLKRSASSNFGVTSAARNLVSSLSEKTKTAVLVFGTPYAAGLLSDATYLVVAYDDDTYTQQVAAEGLFGGRPMNGKLPVGSGKFPVNTGLETADLQKLHWGIPEDVAMNPALLQRIDSVAASCISTRSAPGLTVLVARKGTVVWDKTYGTHKYDGKTVVEPESIYDLASVTKVAATTTALMRLYDEGKFDPSKKVQDYLPETKGTVIGPLVMQDVLTHQSGLTAWIPFYKSTLLSDGTRDPRYYNQSRIPGFEIHVADQVWLRNDYPDSIWARIQQTPLKQSNKYVYSDLGLYITRKVVERLSGTRLDSLVEEEFYRPLDMQHTCFNPLEKFERNKIIPTENDDYFRYQTVQGYVHDMGAAMMGGIEGHAGLFSTSHDLAALFQMYLNGGYYAGQQLLDPGTLALFTKKQSNISRRGLGWDKPETHPDKSSPCSSFASNLTFGHQGFTGICVWADPEYDLLYIFLSNRVQPSASPNNLSKQEIRTSIQDIIYASMGVEKTIR